MAANRIYSFGDSSFYPPGAFQNFVFNIPANNRELKIKSLFVDRGQRESITGIWVPNEGCNDIMAVLNIGPGVAGQEITRMFNFTVGVPQFNGTNLMITSNTYMQFNSFTVMNNLPFTLTLRNVSGGNTYQIYYTLCIEVEENIIWQGPPAESYHVTE